MKNKKKTPLMVACISAVFLISTIGLWLFMPKDRPCACMPPPPNHFKYFFGSYNGGYYEYEIYKDGDKIIFTALGINGVDLDVKREVDYSVLYNIQDIIDDNNAFKWNGFNKRDTDILDGHSFSLLVEYDTDEEIKASGYIKYPKNYQTFEKAIKKYFDELISKNTFDIKISESNTCEKNIITSPYMSSVIYPANYTVYTYCLDKVEVLVDDETYNLRSALDLGIITIEGIIDYMEYGVEYGNWNKLVVRDGGSTLYSSFGFSLLKCNTLDGNRDVYIGTVDMKYEVDFCK